MAAIERLRLQAESETRNRKRLRDPLDQLPQASWEIRAGDHRVFYWVDQERTVQVLRVILKGTLTTAEAVTKGIKP